MAHMNQSAAVYQAVPVQELTSADVYGQETSQIESNTVESRNNRRPCLFVRCLGISVILLSFLPLSYLIREIIHNHGRLRHCRGSPRHPDAVAFAREGGDHHTSHWDHPHPPHSFRGSDSRDEEGSSRGWVEHHHGGDHHKEHSHSSDHGARWGHSHSSDSADHSRKHHGWNHPHSSDSSDSADSNSYKHKSQDISEFRSQGYDYDDFVHESGANEDNAATVKSDESEALEVIDGNAVAVNNEAGNMNQVESVLRIENEHEDSEGI